MAKTISDQTREYFCYIKQKVRKGEKVIPWLSGTKRKRTMMYKETSRYEKDAKIDYELGVISKEEYEISSIIRTGTCKLFSLLRRKHEKTRGY